MKFYENYFNPLRNLCQEGDAAIGIHISIGSIYAWSVLIKPMMAKMGAGLREITWVFSIAIPILRSSSMLGVQFSSMFLPG